MKSNYPIQILSRLSYLLLFLTIVVSSCKKFITIDAPITFTNSEIVYQTDPTAIAAVTGLYTAMSNENFGSGYSFLSLYPGLSADEYTPLAGNVIETFFRYHQNNLDARITNSTNFWTPIYSNIYVINTAIEGLNKATTLTPSIRNQLLGEVYFMRAFSYFYLVNLYGDVPLILTTNYNINSKMSRTPKLDIYNQMIKDLQEAQLLMSMDYLAGSLNKSTTDRVRPNKFAATALLARVYLYNSNWAAAETEATKVITAKETYDTVRLNETFSKNSKETIWALLSVNNGSRANTQEGQFFILVNDKPDLDHPIYLNKSLVESFEANDQRRTQWINTTSSIPSFSYPFKYKIGFDDVPNQENSIVLRLAEQYLIRAEARAQQNNVIGVNSAKSDLDIIRLHAGLTGTTATSKDGILTAILDERRHELFSEWGHRWLDLKRTGIVNEVMQIETQLKGGSWNTNWQLYPIPQDDITRGINLIQNPGYD